MDQVKQMKPSVPSNSNSIEKLSPLVVNLRAKDQSTNVLSQSTPTISTDIPSPRSEEEILEALKESSILAPKREVQQERWNKELFLRIAGVARVISKTKSMRTFKLSSAAPLETVESGATSVVTQSDATNGIENMLSETAEKHTQESAYTASSESLFTNPVEVLVDESLTVSGISPKAPTSEVCGTLRNQEDATTANESTESEATRRQAEELSCATSREVQQDIIVEGVTPSLTRTLSEAKESDVTEKLEDRDASVAEETSPNDATKRHSRELPYAAINEAATETIAAEKGVDETWYINILPLRSPSFNTSNMQTPTPPRKIILTCKMHISASETEKRKIRRKWNYIKVIINDLQEALREKPTSIETAKIIEDSLEELQQVGQDIKASVEEIVPILKKLGAEIKNQSSLDKQILKREISSKLSTELTSLTDSYTQYAETVKQCKKTMDVQENILERVVKRRESHDTKISDQQKKIANIKKELTIAAEELESMEKRRNDLLEEEEECKEETRSTILELKSAENNLNDIKEKVRQINDHLDHLNETIDREFERRKKEMLDLVEQLLELDIS